MPSTTNESADVASQATIWNSLWESASKQVHDKNLPHDGGYCQVCRAKGVSLDGSPVPVYFLGGDTFVALHILGQPIANQLDRIVSMWLLETGVPDLQEWLLGDRNAVLSVCGHNATRAVA